MPVILKLTDEDGRTIFVNAANILCFQSESFNGRPVTKIELPVHNIYVRETPEAVRDVIAARTESLVNLARPR